MLPKDGADQASALSCRYQPKACPRNVAAIAPTIYEVVRISRRLRWEEHDKFGNDAPRAHILGLDLRQVFRSLHLVRCNLCELTLTVYSRRNRTRRGWKHPLCNEAFPS